MPWKVKPATSQVSGKNQLRRGKPRVRIACVMIMMMEPQQELPQARSSEKRERRDHPPVRGEEQPVVDAGSSTALCAGEAAFRRRTWLSPVRSWVRDSRSVGPV